MTWQPKKLTREQMAERRKEGVRLLQSGGMNQAQIARHLGVSEKTISKWKKALENDGPKALQARKASGRPPKLSKTDKKNLIQKLEQGALASGFPTEQWTQARVQKVIEREYGVHYHRDYISRLLHSLGWSVQRPDPRAIERDEELILAWLKKDWPRIKKSAAARRRDRL
jgi:transposase